MASRDLNRIMQSETIQSQLPPKQTCGCGNRCSTTVSVLLSGLAAQVAEAQTTNLIVIGNSNTRIAQSTATLPWQLQCVFGLMLILGLIQCFYPRVGWWLKFGWQFREAPEPSMLWLFVTRLGGLFVALLMGYLLCRGNGFLPSS